MKITELYQNNPAAFWTIVSIVGGFLIALFFWWLSKRNGGTEGQGQKQSQEQSQKQEQTQKQEQHVHISTSFSPEDKNEIIKEIARKVIEGLTPVVEPTPLTGAETSEEKEARDLLEKGNEFYDKEDFETAIDNYTKAIELNPSYADAFYNRGLAYAKKKDYDAAIRDFTKAIELGPNIAGVFNIRGAAYANNEDYDSAIRDYNEAIELDPNYAGAMANMGLAYIKKGDKEKAREWYGKALKKKEYLSDGGEKVVSRWLKDIEE